MFGLFKKRKKKEPPPAAAVADPLDQPVQKSDPTGIFQLTLGKLDKDAASNLHKLSVSTEGLAGNAHEVSRIARTARRK
jgi:hypothetical protein